MDRSLNLFQKGQTHRGGHYPESRKDRRLALFCTADEFRVASTSRQASPSRCPDLQHTSFAALSRLAESHAMSVWATITRAFSRSLQALSRQIFHAELCSGDAMPLWPVVM
mmetsp:Transcript_110543/g.307347  ORF Transcript_110543/g.307347 Transcript_110543/m.307347 type:complete len:111 (-) Transcript_110543:311-643(-)